MKEIPVILPIASENVADLTTAVELPGIQCECGFEAVILCRYGDARNPETLSLVRGVHCPACGTLDSNHTIDIAQC